MEDADEGEPNFQHSPTTENVAKHNADENLSKPASSLPLIEIQPVFDPKKEDVELENDLDERTKFPDGGYGWVVAFASFMCHFIADGLTFSTGVMYPYIVEYFHQSKSLTALSVSLFISVPLICGPIASACMTKFGSRITTIVGALLTALGILVGAFTKSIEVFCLTYGVISGLGLSLVYTPSTLAPSFWFKERRALATGLSVSGSGFGTIAMAPLAEWLLKEYGLRGALLIQSAIALNMVVFGALFRPADHFNRSKDVPSIAEQPKSISSPSILSQPQNEPDRQVGQSDILLSTRSIPIFNQSLEKAPFRYNPEAITADSRSTMPKNLLYHSHQSVLPHSRRNLTSILTVAEAEQRGSRIARSRTYSSCPALSMEYDDTSDKPSSRLRKILKKFRRVLKEIWDPAIFCLPVYTLFFVSNFLLSYSYDMPYTYLYDYSLEYEVKNSSWLISIIGLTNAFGQIIYGFLGDRKAINVVLLYGGSIAFCGILLCLIPLMKTFASLAAFSGLYGLAISASFSLETIVIVKITSLRDLMKGYGMLMFGQGIAGLIGPPIGGLLWDKTGDYTYTWVFAGLSCALAGLIAIAIVGFKQLDNNHSDVSSTSS